MNEEDQQNDAHAPRTQAEVPYSSQSPPIGLASLYLLCKRTYPDQCNPLQANAVVKYW